MTDVVSAPEPAGRDVIGDIENLMKTEKWHKWKLEGFVVITALILSSMLILRSLRRRTGWPITKFCLQATGYLSGHALSYFFGLLSYTILIQGLDVVWAVILVALITITYNLNAESLEDNEAARKRFLWEKFIWNCWFALLVLLDLTILHFLIPILILWVLNSLRLGEQKLALISACRGRFGIDRVATVVVRFMRKESKACVNESTPNPATMQGYRYLVGVDQALDEVFSAELPKHNTELDLNQIATLESIWQCNGRLLSKEGDPDGSSKDSCLSFALFWLLLRRFAGYKLDETSKMESREKSWYFIRYGLIKEQDDDGECERAFRVVGLELKFLYDYFYNKHFAVYSKGFRFLIIRVVVLVLYLFVAFYTLFKIKKIGKQVDHNGEKHPVQVIVTQVILVAITAVEFTHIFGLITSKWTKVKLVCRYVQERWWETRWGRLKGVYLSILCQPAPFFGKSWHGMLHQCSLLDSYGYTPFTLRFRWIMQGYFELPIIGQQEIQPVEISRDVKKAVIRSLQMNGQRLTNGVASLSRNNVQDLLPYACKSNEIITTRIVLIWHIATSMCEIDLNPSPKPDDESDLAVNFRVATSLSKYCAYLVAMAPRLLPDHVYETQWEFEQVVSQVRDALKHSKSKCEKLMSLFRICKSKESKNDKLMSLNDESKDATTLEKGAVLGRKLINETPDASLRWKVLADFWAEMILYLAPSDDVSAHAQYLVTGTELITQLWALLTHAGIVDRDGCGDDLSI